MKKIAIISDTHGLLREEVKQALAGADAIVHAGDLDNPAILKEIQAYGETYIVRGNNDKEWAESLPQSLSFSIEGVRFFMVHDQKDIPKDLTDVDVVIYGHSHKYAMDRRDDILWLNPGSCGKRRFLQKITFVIMDAQEGRYHIEKITISQENQSHPGK